MGYIYNDEDNEPMEDPWLKYTSYSCKEEWEADMRGELDFEPYEPEKGCWDCLNYDPSKCACTKDWNNLDPAYYNSDRDDKEPNDCCSDHDSDPDADWHDFFDKEGNLI